MAYATIAGLPVQVGLNTALVPMVIYAVVGTSGPLSVSATTTWPSWRRPNSASRPGWRSGVLDRASATLTFLVGAILLRASLLRLGFIAIFISEPVLIGFKAGIAVVIVLDQVPSCWESISPRAPLSTICCDRQTIPDTTLTTLAVGIAMILLL